MNNNEIIALVESWTFSDIEYKEKFDLLHAVTDLLIDRDDARSDIILQSLSKEAQVKFYNLLSICSSHQHLLTEDGEFVASQIQVVLPVLFYAKEGTQNPKILKEIHAMIIRSVAQSLLEFIDIEEVEFNFYPKLIEAERFDIPFSQIFHFDQELNSKPPVTTNHQIELDKPVPYFIYCKLVLPGHMNVFNNDLELALCNPLNFRPHAINLEKQFNSYMNINDSDIDIFVGNPSSVPHVLGNVNGDLFIAEVLMQLSYFCDKEDHQDLIAEVSIYEDKTYILIYHDNRCCFVYVTRDEAFQDISGETNRFDAQYYKSILEEQGFKRVMLSYRDFGDDFDKIMGRSIMSF